MGLVQWIYHDKNLNIESVARFSSGQCCVRISIIPQLRSGMMLIRIQNSDDVPDLLTLKKK
jgi:hypothetical protein